MLARNGANFLCFPGNSRDLECQRRHIGQLNYYPWVRIEQQAAHRGAREAQTCHLHCRLVAQEADFSEGGGGSSTVAVRLAMPHFCVFEKVHVILLLHYDQTEILYPFHRQCSKN